MQNIKVNESENLISNAEGYFTLSEKQQWHCPRFYAFLPGFVNQQPTVAELKGFNSTLNH
jgi:hypothetical protein